MLITNNNHLKDMTRLSSAHQTSALESFHNVRYYDEENQTDRSVFEGEIDAVVSCTE